MRIQLQNFLQTKLNIDTTHITLEGIVSNGTTFYILEATPALMEKLNNMTQNTGYNRTMIALGSVVVVLGLLTIGVCLCKNV